MDVSQISNPFEGLYPILNYRRLIFTSLSGKIISFMGSYLKHYFMVYLIMCACLKKKRKGKRLNKLYLIVLRYEKFKL